MRRFLIVSRISRRTVLLGGGVSLAAVAGVGLAQTRDRGTATPPDVTETSPEDAALRAAALTDEEGLAKKSRDVANAIPTTEGPDAAAKLVVLSLLNHHTEHVAFLKSSAGALPRALSAALLSGTGPYPDPVVSLDPSPLASPSVGPSSSSSPSQRPTASATPKPTPSVSKTPSPSPSPQRYLPPPPPKPTVLSEPVHALINTLVAAERSAIRNRRSDFLNAGSDLARILASLAAASAVHVELLSTIRPTT